MSSEPKKPESSVGKRVSVDLLRRRGALLERTRQFFASRDILEVQTPSLGTGVIPDVHIDPMRCDYRPEGGGEEDAVVLYLQSSPEAAMKRLLVAGSGPIYQITHGFRNGEVGRLHNPEFTILEWYRPSIDHHELMDEVGELMRELLEIDGWDKRTYCDVFRAALGVDPLSCETTDLMETAERRGIAPPPGLDESSRNGWLDLLLTTCVQPTLGRDVATFVYDYPPSQAALAKIGGDELPVAERFELFIDGVELCNGYHELLDPREHRLRFGDVGVRRAGMGKEELPVDQEFLAALEDGLPACSGVAVGFDRVVMLASGAESIDDVVLFPLQRRE